MVDEEFPKIRFSPRGPKVGDWIPNCQPYVGVQWTTNRLWVTVTIVAIIAGPIFITILCSCNHNYNHIYNHHYNHNYNHIYHHTYNHSSCWLTTQEQDIERFHSCRGPYIPWGRVRFFCPSTSGRPHSILAGTCYPLCGTARPARAIHSMVNRFYGQKFVGRYGGFQKWGYPKMNGL